MKTILSGKARQKEECIAFVMDWCKEHELNPQIISPKAGAEVVIGCKVSFVDCAKVCIYEESNDLIVESTAGDVTILDDPGPSKTGASLGFVNHLGSFLEKLNPLRFI